ncbi:MAG TPA: hypothetical protein EYP67_04770 [Methanosarcinales archaeon]|nr:hypothetical protein [Methanosarcinales archaeon]
MKTKCIAVIFLLAAGVVLSGCVCDKTADSVSDTTESASSEAAASSDADAVSDEVAEIEFEELEDELAELEAMLGEIDNESDPLAEVNDSMFA